MTRSLMLLPALCLLASCGESEAPVRAVTKEMRMSAAVTIRVQKTRSDSSTYHRHEPGLKVADDLVLMHAFSVYKIKGLPEVRYADRNGIVRSVTSEVIATHDDLDLALLRTKEALDAEDAAFMFIPPKPGARILVMRGAGKTLEGIVHAIELADYGLRFRVWMENAPDMRSFQHGDVVFDQHGSVLGIGMLDALSDHETFEGYDATSHAVLTPKPIWSFIKRYRDAR